MYAISWEAETDIVGFETGTDNIEADSAMEAKEKVEEKRTNNLKDYGLKQFKITEIIVL